MEVIILRAGSGAGKSTWIRRHKPKAIVVSSDQYMVDEDGNYQFDVTKLGEAHADCVRRFVSFCQNPPNAETLIVDNTNTMVAEFAPYAQVALSYGHDLRIVTFVYDPVAAFKRNIHGTPLDKCIEMHARIQEGTKQIPPWWPHEYALWDETWPFANTPTK